MRKFFSFKKEKPLIFNNDQQAIVAKEYKLKLKSLISINEDMRNEVKLSSESLNSYKTYLSEIGLSKKTNLINTSRNFNVKTISLIQKDNTKLVKSIETIKSIISAYEKQLKELNLKFDEKNSLSSDTTLADDQLFILKNSYNAKEAQIMNLQLVIASFIDKKQELYFEYHDIESKTVTNCMDHFMTGIRNEMAKTTRLLNIQKNKAFEHTKNIKDKKKELEDMKHPKNNTPTQTTPEVNLSTKVDTEMNEKTPKKRLRKVKIG